MLNESKFQIKTDEGTEPIVGIAINMMVATDCPFANKGGSGTAISTPTLSIRHEMNGAHDVFLNIEASSPERAVQIARDGLVANHTGKTGDAVLTRHGKVLHTFRTFESTFKLTEEPTPVYNHNRKRVQVPLRYTWENLSGREKGVCFMQKFSFAPCEIEVYDETGNRRKQAAITGGSEAFKDINMIAAEMYLRQTGREFVLDCSEGGMGAEDPEFQKLVAEAKADLTKTVSIIFTVAPHWWDHYYGRFGDRPDCEFLDDRRHILWTGEVLEGEVVMGIEYSPTCQAVGNTQLLLEVLLQVDTVFPELANHFWNAKSACNKRAMLHAHFSMAECALPQGLLTMDYTVDPTKPLPLKSDQSDKELLKSFKFFVAKKAKEYAALSGRPEDEINSKGITLSYGAKKLYLDAHALVTAGAFAEDDEGYSVAGEVADMLRYLANPATGENRTDKTNGLFKRAMVALEMHMLESPRVMGKASRTARLDARRVHTTDDIPMWEVHINPNDPLAKAWKAKGIKSVVAVRTPVLFTAPFRIVENASVPVGVVMVDALCWHMANEGDADGDTIAMLPVPPSILDLNGNPMDTEAEVWKRWFSPENTFATPAGYAAVRQ